MHNFILVDDLKNNNLKLYPWLTITNTILFSCSRNIQINTL